MIHVLFCCYQQTNLLRTCKGNTKFISLFLMVMLNLVFVSSHKILKYRRLWKWRKHFSSKNISFSSRWWRSKEPSYIQFCFNISFWSWELFDIFLRNWSTNKESKMKKLRQTTSCLDHILLLSGRIYNLSMFQYLSCLILLHE